MSYARTLIHDRWCPDSSENVCEDMTHLLNEVESDARQNTMLEIEHRLAAYLTSTDIPILDAAKILDAAMDRTGT